MNEQNPDQRSETPSYTEAELEERVAGFLGTCDQSLRDLLAYFHNAEDEDKELALETLPPAREDLLQEAGVISKTADKVWLTLYGLSVVQKAFEVAEADDPDGSRRRQWARESRERVLGMVARYRAAQSEGSATDVEF